MRAFLCSVHVVAPKPTLGKVFLPAEVCFLTKTEKKEILCDLKNPFGLRLKVSFSVLS